MALAAIGELLGRDKTRCIILNACKYLQKITGSIAAFTIGVSDTVNDDDAMAFSRGFYDALAVGMSFEQAFDEGAMAVNLAGGEAGKF